MLGIFPASGALGTSTLTHLLALLPPEQRSSVVLAARHPDKLKAQGEQGAMIRQADYDRPDTLEPAFEGVKTLCLISYASVQNDHRFEAHKLAIDAAIRAGVSHIVYSSLGFAGAPESNESVTQVMAAHLRTEAYLEELQQEKGEAFSYTIIREGLYAESYPIYTAFFTLSSPSSPIRIPHDGSGPGVAWVKRDELGEATAKILLALFAPSLPSAAMGEFRNSTLLLSGPKVYTLAETVALLGVHCTPPRPDLRIEQVSVDQYAAQSSVKGVLEYGGEDYAVKWATAWEGIRQGETAVVTGDLEHILGRKPETFEETVREMAKQAA
ncbi:hypothetical protein JCM10207_003049 [Rhodosporidiobolus poonsookiae]